MAWLRDVPVVVRSVGPLELIRRIWREVGEDHVMVWAAALAYSWLLAVFPFMIFLLSLLPIVMRHVIIKAHDASEDTIAGIIYNSLPKEAADALWRNIYDVVHQPGRGLLWLGLAFALWAASGGTSMTMAALDTCYDLPRHRSFHRQRLLAILLTVVVSVLICLVVLLVPIASVATHWLASHREAAARWMSEHHLRFGYRPISDGVFLLWDIVRQAIAILVMFLLLALVYRFGPAIRSRFHLFTPGAVFTVVVWLLLGVVFRAYVNHFGRYNQTYGALGGVAILVFFFYIDAVVLLVGAEINSEIDFAMGVPRGGTDFRRHTAGTGGGDEDGDATHA